VTEDVEGKVYRLHGKAEIEGATMLLRADDIEYDENTGDLRASGSVYYHNFERNEQLWADRVEYNTEEETGKYYNVRGEANRRIDARPKKLTTAQPFYFQGEWAERMGDRYILYNGFITDCTLPNPWWRLRGPKFVIVPGDHFNAYKSTFLLRKMPLFYAPFYRRTLERFPRKTGFLTPNIANSSAFGRMIGLGFFWAINRSFDTTYRFQDFTSRGDAHHVDFRGKPRRGTDFDAIIYGVDDRRGVSSGGGPTLHYSGLSMWVAGHSDLGDGWTAQGLIDYVSSFRFQQSFTQSFNEAVGSEFHSVGFVNKDWSSYTFDAVVSRLENFQQSEIEEINPQTNAVSWATDAVTIHKLPEADFSGRDQQIWQNLPLWFSFNSSAGLYYRSEPFYNGSTLISTFSTEPFTPRMNLNPNVTSAFQWDGFSFVPSFGIHETYYGESQEPYQGRVLATPATLLLSARDFSADIIFPSLARVFNRKTIFGDKLKHVIEPRATYRYVTGIGPDFTRVIRFDGTDLLTNTNELAISLTNRIYAKRGDSVQEIFTWTLEQKRYFDPTFGGALIPGQRNVIWSEADLTAYAFLVGPRSSSPVASALTVRPINGLSFDWRTDYDHYQGRITDNSVSVDYRYKKFFSSFGENEVHTNPLLTPSANQVRGLIGFGDTNHRGWNAAFTEIYDLHQGMMQFATTQVTYNTDCCGWTVEYRRFAWNLRNENQFTIGFSIANAGTFGNLKKNDRLF
jgi:LPS-assembly protein